MLMAFTILSVAFSSFYVTISSPKLLLPFLVALQDMVYKARWQWADGWT